MKLIRTDSLLPSDPDEQLSKLAKAVVEVQRLRKAITVFSAYDDDETDYGEYLTEEDATNVRKMAAAINYAIRGNSADGVMPKIAEILGISPKAIKLDSNNNMDASRWLALMRIPFVIGTATYYVDNTLISSSSRADPADATTCRQQLAADLASETGLHIALVESLIHETLRALPAQGVGYFPLPGRLNNEGVALLKEKVLDFVKGSKPCASYKIRDISADLQRTLGIGTNITWLLSQQLAENCEIVLFDIVGEAYTNRGGDELLRQKAAESMQGLEKALSDNPASPAAKDLEDNHLDKDTIDLRFLISLICGIACVDEEAASQYIKEACYNGQDLIRFSNRCPRLPLKNAITAILCALHEIETKQPPTPTAADVMAGNRDALRALYPNATEFGIAALADMLANHAWKKALLEVEQPVVVTVNIGFGTELRF